MNITIERQGIISTLSPRRVAAHLHGTDLWGTVESVVDAMVASGLVAASDRDAVVAVARIVGPRDVPGWCRVLAAHAAGTGASVACDEADDAEAVMQTVTVRTVTAWRPSRR